MIGLHIYRLKVYNQNVFFDTTNNSANFSVILFPLKSKKCFSP